jgi:hypothetical protein
VALIADCEKKHELTGAGMVLCLKSAEALTHMLCGDKRDAYDWFPESFVISEKRLRETVFKGRKGMKAPPEVAGGEFVAST